MLDVEHGPAPDVALVVVLVVVDLDCPVALPSLLRVAVVVVA